MLWQPRGLTQSRQHWRRPQLGIYIAEAVRFDGANDWLESDAPVLGVNSKVGIISFWFKHMGGDGDIQMYQENAQGGGDGFGMNVRRQTDNTIRIKGGGEGPTVIILATTTATFIADGTWRHFLLAWNTATSTIQLYITDTSTSLTVTTMVADGIIKNDSAEHGIGGRVGGSFWLNAEIADYYYTTQESLDLSVTANRRKFISAALAPVDLGNNGSTPTGTSPDVFFHGPVSTWHTNDGTGGGFTVFGTLTAASNNPP
jgi:hypothetical protein